jgi:ribosomal protein L2
MSIRIYKSYTPGTRNRALSSFNEITKTKPEIKDEIIEELLPFVIVVADIKDFIV